MDQMSHSLLNKLQFLIEQIPESLLNKVDTLVKRMPFDLNKSQNPYWTNSQILIEQTPTPY